MIWANFKIKKKKMMINNKILIISKIKKILIII